MSELKISPNLFIEVNELNRLVKFLKQDGYVKLIKSIVPSVGIVQNDLNDNFKVALKEGTADTIIINPGLAFDSDLNAIMLENSLEVVITDTGMKKWIVLSYAIKNDEKGLVNITANGTLTGTGTEFTKVLRSQSQDHPTKVHFVSDNNTQDYEVLQLTSDTLAIVAGAFTPESGLKYSVVGAFTPGFILSPENKFIYDYDYCNISIVDSDEIPALTGDQFILASLIFDTGVVVVTDKRADYMFNDVSASNSNFINSELRITNDPLVALNGVSRIEERRLELSIQHGYDVNTYEVINSTTPIFRIVTGTCILLGTGDIPDNYFKGWILLNRKNMKSVLIQSNTGKSLYVPKFNNDILASAGNDFIVVPNYEEIEFEFKFTGGDDRFPIYKKISTFSHINRFDFPIEYGVTNIALAYRLISANYSTPFNPLAVANFVNIKSEVEILANSAFNVNIVQTVGTIRNYS